MQHRNVTRLLEAEYVAICEDVAERFDVDIAGWSEREKKMLGAFITRRSRQGMERLFDGEDA